MLSSSAFRLLLVFVWVSCVVGDQFNVPGPSAAQGNNANIGVCNGQQIPVQFSTSWPSVTLVIWQYGTSVESPLKENQTTSTYLWTVQPYHFDFSKSDVFFLTAYNDQDNTQYFSSINFNLYTCPDFTPVSAAASTVTQTERATVTQVFTQVEVESQIITQVNGQAQTLTQFEIESQTVTQTAIASHIVTVINGQTQTLTQSEVLGPTGSCGTSQSTNPNSTSSSSSATSTAVKAGAGTAGAVVGVAAVGALAYFLRRRSQRKYTGANFL